MDASRKKTLGVGFNCAKEIGKMRMPVVLSNSCSPSLG